MSAPNSLIASQTATVTVDFDATECDRIVVMTNAVLGAAETVTILYPTTGAATAPVYISPGGAAAVLTPTLQSLVLEGGFLYRIVKSVTVAATGVDIGIKRSQGT